MRRLRRGLSPQRRREGGGKSPIRGGGRVRDNTPENASASVKKASFTVETELNEDMNDGDDRENNEEETTNFSGNNDNLQMKHQIERLTKMVSAQSRLLEKISSSSSSKTLLFPKEGTASLTPPAAKQRRKTKKLNRRMTSASFDLSQAASKSNAGDESGALNPIMIGDLVTLQDADEDTMGMLLGDLAGRRCGVQQQTARESRSYGDFLFRVIPCLRYRQANDLNQAITSREEAERLAEESAAQGSGVTKPMLVDDDGMDGDGEAEEDEEAMEKLLTERREHLLRRRASDEVAHNNTLMSEVQSGQHKTPIRYGQTVQLQHVASGLFLTESQVAAPLDPECHKVALTEGSSSSHFKFMPRFKAQTEGSIVYYGNSVIVESCNERENYLHTSAGAVFDMIRDPLNQALPRCLRTYKTCEVNLSAQFSTFQVDLAGRLNSQDASRLITGAAFRLYHSQSESFVSASCDSEKGEVVVDDDGDGRSDRLVTQQLRPWFNGRLLPAHIPYLKVLADGTSARVDPSDKNHHTAKSLWVIEPAHTRAARTSIPWDKPCRLRHLTSGKYLAVDTPSGPIKEIGSEFYYGCSLVDDSSVSDGNDDDAELLTLAAEDAGLNTSLPPKCLVFHITCSDKSEDGFIPNIDSSVRIEHRFVDPDTGEREVLFLHNSGDRKPKYGGPELAKSAQIGSGGKAESPNNPGEVTDALDQSNTAHATPRSWGIVFSTTRSAQDIMKLMITEEDEVKVVTTVKAHIPRIKSFAVQLQDNECDVSTASVNYQSVVQQLMDVINLFVVGRVSRNTADASNNHLDWVKKANETLPAAFAKTFDGEPDHVHQNLARDMKLLDACFQCTTAAYQRTRPQRPFGDGTGSGALSSDVAFGVKAVIKFAHVVMQNGAKRNRATEMYIAARRTESGKAWMNHIMDQLDDPLGSAVTLAALLSSNSRIMKQYATPELLDRFVSMIQRLGPQPRLIQFFGAISAVDGIAVKANQEMILRKVWMRGETRRKTMLEIVTTDAQDGEELAAAAEQYLPALPKGKKLSSGALNEDGSFSREAIESFPDKFIGKSFLEENEGKMAATFVKWNGHEKWRGSDPLFLGPDSPQLGFPPMPWMEYDTGGSDGQCQLVRIEDLCWVLQPEELCEAVTGKIWKQLELEMAKDEDEAGGGKKAAFKLQRQLASYFVSQVHVLCSMCLGRSSNVIAFLEKSFTYQALVGICRNLRLPPNVRAAFLRLTHRLYLDRYPQIPCMGRPMLPEQLWVYEIKRQDIDVAALPLIHEAISLDEEGALPAFSIPQSHRLSGHSDEKLSFPSHTKFFLLRQFCNEHLANAGGGGITSALVHADREANALTIEVMEIIQALLSYGFQSTISKISDLLTVAVPLLDGRNDVKRLAATKQHNQHRHPHDGVVPFEPMEERFAADPDSMHVTFTKRKILQVLMTVADLRANFRLGKILSRFKKLNESAKGVAELKKHHKLVLTNNTRVYHGDLLGRKIYQDFEALFEEGDGARMDFDELCGFKQSGSTSKQVNTILLDCLMYEDDKLFSAALALLERTYGQRKKLLDSIQEITLLHRGSVAIFDNVSNMISRFANLANLVKCTERWGVASKVAGPFEKGQASYHEMLETTDMAKKFLVTSPVVFDLDKIHLPSMANFPQKNAKGTSTTEGAGAIEMTRIDEEHEDEAEIDDETTSIGRPVTFHQDVFRSMNVQHAFVDALSIDYNIAFRGSICTPGEKVESRRMLVATMRRSVELLILFVTGNFKNQLLIYRSALPQLTALVGPLKMPNWPGHDTDFTEEHWSEMVPPTSKEPANSRKRSIDDDSLTGLGAEMVIIECLRNNEDLVKDEVHRDLIETFGEILNAEVDPSESPILDFFSIICRPTNGLSEHVFDRNQQAVLDVLQMPHLERLKSCVEVALGVWKPLRPGMTAPECAMPERIVDLLCRITDQGNVRTATRLQRSGITVEVILKCIGERIATIVATDSSTNVITGRGGSSEGRRAKPKPPKKAKKGSLRGGGVLKKRMDDKRKATEQPSEDEIYHQDEYLCNLLRLLAGHMSVLVVAPRVYRSPTSWLVVSEVGRHVLHYCAMMDGGSESVAGPEASMYPVVLALLAIIKELIQGARGLGIDEEARHEEALKSRSRVPPAHPECGQPETLSIKLSCRYMRQDNLPDILANELLDLGYLLDPTAVAGEIAGRKARSSVVGTEAITNEKNTTGEDSQADAQQYAPQEMLHFFYDALQSNELIKNKMNKRRFMLVDVMENVADATAQPKSHLEKSPDGSTTDTETGSLRPSLMRLTSVKRRESQIDVDAPFGVEISWEMLVERMVRFCTAHNHDKEFEQDMIRIFRIFLAHLQKVRANEDGFIFDITEIQDHEERAEMLDRMREQQDGLDALGVTTVVLTAIATHPANVESNVADHALELLQELLLYGNCAVQKAVLDFMVEHDKESRVLNHIKERMDASITEIVDRNERVTTGFEPMRKEQRVAYVNAQQTLQLITSLCEGHNSDAQNMLREQPMLSQGDINIVAVVIHTVIVLVVDSRRLHRMEEVEVQLLLSTLDALVELIQGPCSSNQDLVAEHGELVEALDFIMDSKLHERVGLDTSLFVRARSLNVLVSCLEGRGDLRTHRAIAAELRPVNFESVRALIISSHDELKAHKEMHVHNIPPSSFTTRELARIAHDGPQKMHAFGEIAISAMVDLTRIYVELSLLPSFKRDLDETARQRKLKGNDNLSDVMETSVGKIEVSWRGHVEAVCFPLPPESRYLSEATKAKFMAEVDLSTADRRMKELFGAMDTFVAEMERIHYLAETYWIYKLVAENIVGFKKILYALVVLLNLNVLMVSYGDDGQKGGKGYNHIGEHIIQSDEKTKEFAVSIYTTLFLAAINFIGYIILVIFLGITEVPILISQIDSDRDDKVADPLFKTAMYRQEGAFTSWSFGLILTVFFIYMHNLNYGVTDLHDTGGHHPDNHDVEHLRLYLCLLLGLNLPWLLISTRQWIVVPDTPRTRLFAIAYDVCLSKPLFRNHVILMLINLCGFYRNEFFSLMLMDVMNNSPVMQDIIKCVTVPGTQLASVFYLFIVTAVIYSQFGLQHFEENFSFGDDDGHGCHSAVACFWLIMHNAMSAGDIREVLGGDGFNRARDDGPGYMLRILFDISFFVWVGVLLFNIISGLMIDTFAGLREEAGERDDIRENVVFVSDIKRESYEDGCLPGMPKFEALNEELQDKWNYVFFIYHLNAKKSVMDYSGVDSYVKSCIDNDDLTWIPNRTCLVLQNAGAHSDEDNASDVELGKVTGQMAANVQVVMTKIEGMENRLAQIERDMKGNGTDLGF